MKTTNRNNVITLEEARRRGREIPPIWRKAQELLKGKFTGDPVMYQRRIRKESETRLHRQIKIARKRP